MGNLGEAHFSLDSIAIVHTYVHYIQGVGSKIDDNYVDG